MGLWLRNYSKMKLIFAFLFFVVAVGVISTRVEEIEDELRDLHNIEEALKENELEDEEELDAIERSQQDPWRRRQPFRGRRFFRRVGPYVPIAVRLIGKKK